MAKKSMIISAILAMLAFGACTCWGYTVSKWPAPGIPNTVYDSGSVVPGSGGHVGYGGYGGYGGHGGYGWFGNPGYDGGYYGSYGTGYYGQGWRR